MDFKGLGLPGFRASGFEASESFRAVGATDLGMRLFSGAGLLGA